MGIKPSGARIVYIEPGSAGDRAGLKPGDKILEIDGHQPKDLMDLLDRAAWGDVTFKVERNGDKFICKFTKLEEEPLGIQFDDTIFDRVKTCRNKCVFCFMDQMPKKMRPSLYYRDDDYRLSTLHGNFITLTNLSEAEWERIKVQRISPLYISVHATDREVRKRLLGNTRRSDLDIMASLRRLASWGIEMHTQIVLVPGINDGAILQKTLDDLCSLYPAVTSIAVVPVGLTKYRAHLPQLRTVTKDQIPGLLDLISKYQSRNLKRYNTSLIYLSDEIYILGELEFPPHSHYEGYPQLENGVGMARKWITDFNRRKAWFPKSLVPPMHWVLLTGEYGRFVLTPLLNELRRRVKGLRLDLIVVKNDFFGGTVRCAGLMAGRDIVRCLEREQAWNQAEKGTMKIMISGAALRDAAVVGARNDGLLLDDISLQDLADYFQIPFVNGGNSCPEWLSYLLGRSKAEEYHPRSLEAITGNSKTARGATLRIINYPAPGSPKVQGGRG